MAQVLQPTIRTREQIDKDLRRGVRLNDAPGEEAGRPTRKPEWLKVRVRQGENFTELRNIMRERGLHTVCEEAACPNIYECWEAREATFLLGGDLPVHRLGYGAMQLTGPGVWGEPADRPGAIAQERCAELEAVKAVDQKAVVSQLIEKRDADVVAVIRGVIQAEQGAIDHYMKIISTCADADPVTADMVTTILADEEGHLREFEGFLKEYERK